MNDQSTHSLVPHGPQTPQSARTFARFAHDLGFNIVAIGPGLKAPRHRWTQWQTDRQQRSDMESLRWFDPERGRSCSWSDAERCGLINGIGGLRNIDIDAPHAIENAPRPVVSDAVIAALIAALGLPHDYPWVERSGSGTGWHLWFLCDDLHLPEDLRTKRPTRADEPVSVCSRVSRDERFSHLELRWSRCQTVVASSDGISRWRSAAPLAAPAFVPVERVAAAVRAITVAPPLPVRPVASPVPPQRSVALHAGTALADRRVMDDIRARFDLEAYARTAFSGEITYERHEVHVHGQGGLYLNTEEGTWFCFREGFGGDCFDLVLWHRFGAAWDKHDAAQFREALTAAAAFTGVVLPERPAAPRPREKRQTLAERVSIRMRSYMHRVTTGEIA